MKKHTVNSTRFEPIRRLAQDPKEPAAEAGLRNWFFAEEAFIEQFETIEEPQSHPDLIGKSLLAGPKQYPRVQEITEDVCNQLGVPLCPIYIKESYLYTADSEGLDVPRLELSARMVRDFSEEELRHRIAKECYHIAAGHLHLEVMTEQLLQLIKAAPSLPGLNIIKMFGGSAAFEAAAFRLRSVAFKWFEHATYSAENFAVAFTGNLEAGLSATLTSVLSDRSAWESLDLAEYMNQIQHIEACAGPFEAMDRMDEVHPYGPYRVRNMLRYAISDRAQELQKLLEQKSVEPVS